MFYERYVVVHVELVFTRFFGQILLEIKVLYVSNLEVSVLICHGLNNVSSWCFAKKKIIWASTLHDHLSQTFIIL